MFFFQILPNTEQIKLPISDLDSDQRIQAIQSQQSSILSTARLSLGNISFVVERGYPTDTLRIDCPDNLDFAKTNQVIFTAQEFFKFYVRTESMDKLLGDELAEFYRRREQGLLRLEDIAEKLIRETEEYRHNVDRREEDRRIKMETDFKERLQSLEEQYLGKDKQISDRETELEKQKKELDDRSGRHARRQIYRDLKESLKARNTEFSLTKQTQGKRKAVHYVFWALSAAIVAFTVFAYIDTDSVQWYRMSRLSAGMLGLSATLVWYIRWNDQWFREHAEEEFRLKRLDLDIDRASWIVEMALEFKDEKGSEIPPGIIDCLSQNLFVAGDGVQAVKHPTEDAYMKLLKIISSLRLNIPGVGEAVIDHDGINKLRKNNERGK